MVVMKNGAKTMNTVIQARIDIESKKQAENILSKLGISLNDAVRMLVKQIIQNRALPFQPHIVEDEPSERLKQILSECEDDIKHNRVQGPFNNAQELMDALEKD
jgi:DNA-damage-inducible protein J